MSRTPRLSPDAKRRIDEIAQWTAGEFGARQARTYGGMITRTLARIRAGTAAHRSVCDVLAPRAPEDLRFVRVGSHVVLFRERGEVVEVTDVLHEAMD